MHTRILFGLKNHSKWNYSCSVCFFFFRYFFLSGYIASFCSWIKRQPLLLSLSWRTYSHTHTGNDMVSMLESRLHDNNCGVRINLQSAHSVEERINKRPQLTAPSTSSSFFSVCVEMRSATKSYHYVNRIRAYMYVFYSNGRKLCCKWFTRTLTSFGCVSGMFLSLLRLWIANQLVFGMLQNRKQSFALYGFDALKIGELKIVGSFF